MTIEEAMELIHGVEWRGSRPGLTRVRELLHRLGDPQDGLQFVHIAGTNGKGSTAAMLAAVLQAAGYTTGLFTSPFLEQFAERMQVNGQPIPDAELAAACETLQPCIAAMDDQPTEFELVTAAAMLWFQRRGCDVVVLEVGLGGRLDATNVIAAPACAVITNIGLDHTEILGDTLEQIAREKAGILKPGTCAVSYPQAPEVRRVLREICAQRGIPLTEADASAIVPLTDSVDGQTFTYRSTEYALEQIYNIIDSRYRSRKPLIVTTNLTLTELKNPQDTAHARIYDRLLELCTPIACTGPSMRKDIGQAKLNLLKTLLA